MAGLFSLLGGMGGMGRSSGCKHPGCGCSREEGESSDAGLVVLLMSLLQKEQADPGLLMALMYILM